MSIVDTIFIYFIQCTIHGHFKHLFVLVFYCFQTRNVVVDQCGGNCAYRRAEARHQWPKKESQGECQSINVKDPDPHLFGLQAGEYNLTFAPSLKRGGGNQKSVIMEGNSKLIRKRRDKK